MWPSDRTERRRLSFSGGSIILECTIQWSSNGNGFIKIILMKILIQKYKVKKKDPRSNYWFLWFPFIILITRGTDLDLWYY